MDSVLGHRTGRSPGNKVIHASALSTCISITVYEENRVAKNIIHICTGYVELVEVEHWKYLPSTLIGQHFPSKGFLSLILGARAK